METGGEILFIHNPGSRRGAAAAGQARSLLARTGGAGPCRWVEIAALGEVPRNPLPERVVAIGGDGTVNAAAAWIAGLSAEELPVGPGGAAGEPLLGIVPAGTGNNLARDLGLPLDRAAALRIATAGATERRIDLVRYRALDDPAAPPPPRVLVQSGQFGFPAEINAWFHDLRRSRAFRAAAAPFGTLVYRLLGFVGLARRRRDERRGVPEARLRLRARLSGEEIERDVLALFLGNGATLGGGFRPCPRAEPDDGLLDLCLVRSGMDLPYFRLFREVLRGRHIGRDGVEYVRTPGPIDLRFDAAAPFLVDGDIWLSARAWRVEVLPRRIRVAAGP